MSLILAIPAIATPLTFDFNTTVSPAGGSPVGFPGAVVGEQFSGTLDYDWQPLRPSAGANMSFTIGGSSLSGNGGIFWDYLVQDSPLHLATVFGDTFIDMYLFVSRAAQAASGCSDRGFSCTGLPTAFDGSALVQGILTVRTGRQGVIDPIDGWAGQSRYLNASVNAIVQTPEPSTGALAGTGILLAAAIASRKRG